METIRKISNEEYEVLVIHPNGESKWFAIESYQERFISIRWGLAGTYDIMAKDGRMIARSLKARQKTPSNLLLWKAANYKDVRLFLAEKYGIPKDEIEERFTKHVESMPKRCRSVLSKAKGRTG